MEFSEQVDKTNASMQQMGRTRVNATINATDNASGVVESVRQTVEECRQYNSIPRGILTG